MDDPSLWIAVIETAGPVGVVLLGSFLLYVYAKKNGVSLLNAEQKFDANALFKMYQDEVSKREQQQVEINELKAQLAHLQAQLLILQSAQDSYPYPSWLKDRDGTMLYVNKAYEEMFLIPRGYSASDYIGHKDRDVWPEEVARVFAQHDHQTMTEGKTINVAEPIETADGSIEILRFIKWPRKVGDHVLGAAGIFYPPPED